MKFRDWMAFKKLLDDRKVFSLQDLAVFLSVYPGPRRESLRVLLHRAVRDGILWRLCKGWYAFMDDLPDPDRAAATIARPAYVSMERALSVQGVLSQGIFIITVMTPRAWRSKKPFRIEYPDGSEYPVEVRHATRLYGEFLGGVAIPEAAVADLLCVRGAIEGKWSYLWQIVLDIYWDEVNVRKVIEEISERPPRVRKPALRFLGEIAREDADLAQSLASLEENGELVEAQVFREP